MRAVVRRIGRLENQFGIVDEKQRILLVVCDAGWGDQDTSIQILRECGFLPTDHIGVVNFCNIPAGMNAEEAERFLRERGAEICSR